MSVNREAIYLALFERLKDKLGAQFVTIGRRHVAPPTLAPEQQPALFSCAVRESANPGRSPIGTGGRLRLTAFLVVYCCGPDPGNTNEELGQESDLAETKLNTLLQAIDDAIRPDAPQDRQTLGDLVYNCWIESDTPIEPGFLDGQAFALVPVFMEVPNPL